MNNIWNPVQFLYRFNNSFEENSTLIIIWIHHPSSSANVAFPLEILIIVNKINLYSLFWYRSHFNNQRHIIPSCSNSLPNSNYFVIDLLSLIFPYLGIKFLFVRLDHWSFWVRHKTLKRPHFQRDRHHFRWYI
jgi:hypothetical protein